LYAADPHLITSNVELMSGDEQLRPQPDPPADPRALALVERGRAFHGLGRVLPSVAVRRLAAALAIVQGTAAEDAPHDRADLDHLRSVLRLEVTLLAAVRGARLRDAAAAYADLGRLHGRPLLGQEALAHVPESVRHFATRSPDAVSLLVFALPYPRLAPFLQAVVIPM
jgi:hypothetical protein